MDPFAQKKDQIYNDLLDIILPALDEGQMTLDESQKIAEFISQKLEEATTDDQIITFLKELSDLWSIFQPLYVRTSGVNINNNDQAKIDQIKSSLDALNTDQPNQ